MCGVPLDPVVGEAAVGGGPDQGEVPPPAQHLHPVLPPAQIVGRDLPVRLERGSPLMNQSAIKYSCNKL